MDARVYDPEAVEFSPSDCPPRPRHSTALFVDPAHFDVHYQINPHMGGEVDRELARRQWRSLVDVYDEYADAVEIIDPDEVWETFAESGRTDLAPPEDLPDMVFAANQSLPYPDEDRVVLSRMANREREDEVEYFEEWYDSEGYDTEWLSGGGRFEGMGDALWYPGRELLLGGHGFRTERESYDELADLLGVPVIPLELTSEECYHLDVCLSVLDESTALVYPSALSDDSVEALEGLFETLVEVPREEALEGFACNAHSIDGEHVAIQAGNPTTVDRLRDHGFSPVEVETGEFMKAGGSVFCMKLMLP